MTQRLFLSIATLAGIIGLASCSDPQMDESYSSGALAKDPILARALNDPLMTDPDLASRNQSNALIAFHDSQPLPAFAATEGAASKAREAARLQLLNGGQVETLPAAIEDKDAVSLAGFTNAGDMIDAVGSRTDCIESMDASLLWST